MEQYHDGPPQQVTEQPLRPIKTHCPYGHQYTPENTYFHPKYGRSYCKTCRRLQQQGNTAHLKKLGFEWNDETVGELRRLNALHYSASWIASEFLGTFGFRVTRNAILGKLFRLGLSNPMPQARRQERRSPRPRQAKLRIGGWQARPRLEVVEQPPVMDDSAIPLEQRKTLFELHSDSCRWPVGEPGVDLFYCGAVADGGRSYCRAHHARAYTGFGRPHV